MQPFIHAYVKHIRHCEIGVKSRKIAYSDPIVARRFVGEKAVVTLLLAIHGRFSEALISTNFSDDSQSKQFRKVNHGTSAEGR
jgi:hypothetical protein